MNDLLFTDKNKKGLQGQNYPYKPYKFNEILLGRMKSKRVWMKSSVAPQMKLNPHYLNLAKQDFITK